MRVMGEISRKEEHQRGFSERITTLDRIRHERIGIAETLNDLIHRYENEIGPSTDVYDWSKDLIHYRTGYLRAVHYVVEMLHEANRRQQHELYGFLIWEHDELFKDKDIQEEDCSE